MDAMKRLLMVNDDMVEMESLPFMYKRHGIDLVVVGSVKDALEQLKKNKFDFILTDISLIGRETGIDLIKEVRKTNKDTKIAVSTGYSDEYKDQAMAAGANYYFEKPLDLSEHVLKPMGLDIERKPQEEKKPMPAREKGATLRQAVHEINNRDNLVIMVSGLLKEAAQTFIKEKHTPKEIKEFLQRVVDDSSDIEDAGKNADELLKKVRGAVYPKLNPDDVVIE
jgi:DNA-binding NtrC family response regulator